MLLSGKQFQRTGIMLVLNAMTKMIKSRWARICYSKQPSNLSGLNEKKVYFSLILQVHRSASISVLFGILVNRATAVTCYHCWLPWQTERQSSGQSPLAITCSGPSEIINLTSTHNSLCTVHKGYSNPKGVRKHKYQQKQPPFIKGQLKAKFGEGLYLLCIIVMHTVMHSGRYITKVPSSLLNEPAIHRI